MGAFPKWASYRTGLSHCEPTIPPLPRKPLSVEGNGSGVNKVVRFYFLLLLRYCIVGEILVTLDFFGNVRGCVGQCLGLWGAKGGGEARKNFFICAGEYPIVR